MTVRAGWGAAIQGKRVRGPVLRHSGSRTGFCAELLHVPPGSFLGVLCVCGSCQRDFRSVSCSVTCASEAVGFALRAWSWLSRRSLFLTVPRLPFAGGQTPVPAPPPSVCPSPGACAWPARSGHWASLLSCFQCRLLISILIQRVTVWLVICTDVSLFFSC